MTVQLEDQSDFTQASSTGSVFVWQASGGINYNLNDHLGALLEIGYLNAGKLKINNENRNNNAGRLVTDQPMSWLNTSVGLAYKF
jgi:opacity protein-like surface antigen